MREISLEARKSLFWPHGTEPLLIVAIDWFRSGNFTYYADKTIYSAANEVVIEGRILELPSVESIMNVTGSGSSISINVVLDDNDLYFLRLLDNVDIHMVPCKLIHYFDGMDLADSFVLFEGQLVSDFIWEDENKTLRFSMQTVFNNFDAGFSPEEGDVAGLRESLVGKAWPMGFGLCHKAPTVLITEVPVGITTEPMGIHDYWLDMQIDRLSNQSQFDYSGIATFYFLAALQAYHSDEDEIGDEMTELGNQALMLNAEKDSKLQDLRSQLTDQMAYDKTQSYVLTDYPINLAGLFEVGGNWLNGTIRKVRNKEGLALFKFTSVYHNIITMSFAPDRATIEAQTKAIAGAQPSGTVPPTPNPGFGPYSNLLEGPITRGVNNFVYIQAGSQVKYLGNYPVRYVVNIIPSKILAVYANRTFEGITRRMKVPKSYWKEVTVTAQMSKQLPNKTFRCTAIQMFRPLSVLFNQHWSDDVFVTYESSVGDTFQAIITYIVRTFSLYDVDEASLNAVPAFRLNFCLTELVDTLELVRDICYQNKTACILKNGKFYFIYLPKYVPLPVSITVNDIVEDTFKFSFLPTEDVVTKMVGTWRVDLSDEKQNRVVTRYNVNKYGTHSEEHNFFTFNTQKSVEATMSFWLYRKGNSWKRVEIQTPIKYLILENYDIIVLDATVTGMYGINNGQPCPATVMDLAYDTSANMLTLVLELPIKLGENIIDWNYWPSGSFNWMGNTTSQIFNNIQPPKWWNGIDYTPISQLGPLMQIDTFGEQNRFTGYPAIAGVQFNRDLQLLHTHQELIAQMQTQNPPQNGSQPNPVTGDYGGTLGDYIAPKYSLAGNQMSIDSTAPTVPPPMFMNSYQDPGKPESQPAASKEKPEGAAFPGKVQGGQGTKYSVQIYPQGLSNKPTTVNATCLTEIKDPIPKDYGVIVASIPVKKGKTTTFEYYFTVPTWQS